MPRIRPASSAHSTDRPAPSGARPRSAPQRPRFGVDVRIGLHTGECDVRNDTISGVAVDTAAQIAAHAATSEVLVSRTVKDLVAGSGLRFEDHGKHSLDGVASGWRLFAVERGVQPRA